MRKAALLALGILVVIPTCASAQYPPQGCSWEGEAAIRFAWGMVYQGWSGYTPPPGVYNVVANQRVDTTWGLPGQSLTFRVGPYNATAWIPQNCTALDTFCYTVRDQLGWSIVLNPVAGTLYELPPGGYFWTQYVTINIPCSATPGTQNLVIGRTHYSNVNGDCDETCGDCTDPSYRSGRAWWSADSLIVKVLTPNPPSPPAILQDTLTLVERGQTQAYIPFSLCNVDQCFPYTIGYGITSKGRVGSTLNLTGTLSIAPGKCTDVYGIVDAGSAVECQFDTLMCIAWICPATPERLDFSGDSIGKDFLTLSPKLNQTFFIGDGLTAGAVRQVFNAPRGATRLFLGFADRDFDGLPGYYHDNSGSLNARFTVDSFPCSLTVDARANIFGAGLSVPPAPGGIGGGILPPSVALPPGESRTVEFASVTGLVNQCPPASCEDNGPDGAPGEWDNLSWEYVSGIVDRDSHFYLVGVFTSPRYDTCVQVIHVVEEQPVPLSTLPVMTVLALSLMLTALAFMRRRAGGRA